MQKTVRTFFINGGDQISLNELQKLLDKGYKVKFATKTKDYIEYILEI